VTRFILISAAFMVALAYLYDWLKKRAAGQTSQSVDPIKKIYKRYQAKVDPQEPWIQLYETANREEALHLKARLEEQDVKIILVEQAKKDLSGNVPPGISLAVPRSHLRNAQNLLCRYLEQL